METRDAYAFSEENSWKTPDWKIKKEMKIVQDIIQLWALTLTVLDLGGLML
jgi:hypothetical protein